VPIRVAAVELARPRVEQLGHYLLHAVLAREQQRRVAIRVGERYISAVLDEQLRRLRLALLARAQQQRVSVHEPRVSVHEPFVDIDFRV